MTYRWYIADNIQGEAETRDEAMAEIRRYAPWIDEAIVADSPDGGTEYFYETPEEAEADEDGAFAVHITTAEE